MERNCGIVNGTEREEKNTAAERGCDCCCIERGEEGAQCGGIVGDESRTKIIHITQNNNKKLRIVLFALFLSSSSCCLD